MAEKVLAQYTPDSTGEEIKLTANYIRQVIATQPTVTDKECYLFAQLCASQRLDPRIREAYLIKYGSNPATMVVGKDVFVKRAAKNPRFQGMEAGVTLISADGEHLLRRDGSMVLHGETLVGGWCRVYVEGYEKPMFDEVSFDEYAGRRKDGSLNRTWQGKPGTMIRKVAEVHALREAFPEDFSGLYDTAEMGVEEPIDAENVKVEESRKKESPVATF